MDTVGWLIDQAGTGWTITDTADRVYTLGDQAASQLADPRAPTRIARWLLSSFSDPFGHTVHYTWQGDGAQRYLSTIGWGTYTLRFSYEARPDVLLDGRFGFLLRTALRCQRIELQASGQAHPSRAWELAYTGGTGGPSQLASITMTGYDADGSMLSAPPTTFGYSAAGAPALERFTGTLPPGLASDGAALIDLDGDGLPDLLDVAAGTARRWPNLGRLQWGMPQPLRQIPAPLTFADSTVALADMNGDRTADLVFTARGVAGYYPWLPAAASFRPSCGLALRRRAWPTLRRSSPTSAPVNASCCSRRAAG